MTRSASSQLTYYVLGLAVVAVLGVYAHSGAIAARSAAAGAAVGVANWFALRFLVARLLVGSVRRKTFFTGLLFLKLTALLGVVFVLLYSGLCEPLPFTVGLSTLIVGVLLGASVHALTAAPVAESES